MWLFSLVDRHPAHKAFAKENYLKNFFNLPHINFAPALSCEVRMPNPKVEPPVHFGASSHRARSLPRTIRSIYAGPRNRKRLFASRASLIYPNAKLVRGLPSLENKLNCDIVAQNLKIGGSDEIPPIKASLS